MEYVLKESAKKTLEELDVEKAEYILTIIEEVTEEGLEHDKVKLIQDRNGQWLYRIKIVSEICNYRAFVDYIDGKLEILDILHRDIAYEGEFGNKN